jgi:hypothetical protein
MGKGPFITLLKVNKGNYCDTKNSPLPRKLFSFMALINSFLMRLTFMHVTKREYCHISNERNHFDCLAAVSGG